MSSHEHIHCLELFRLGAPSEAGNGHLVVHCKLASSEIEREFAGLEVVDPNAAIAIAARDVTILRVEAGAEDL